VKKNFLFPSNVTQHSGRDFGDLTRSEPPKGSWGREIPLLQGNLGWWNIWPSLVQNFWIVRSSWSRWLIFTDFSSCDFGAQNGCQTGCFFLLGEPTLHVYTPTWRCWHLNFCSITSQRYEKIWWRISLGRKKLNPIHQEEKSQLLTCFFEFLGWVVLWGNRRLSIERLPFARSKWTKPRYAPSLLSTGSETWVDFDSRVIKWDVYGVYANYSDLKRPGPPNGGLVREMGPRKFQGNLGWWHIIIT